MTHNGLVHHPRSVPLLGWQRPRRGGHRAKAVRLPARKPSELTPYLQPAQSSVPAAGPLPCFCVERDQPPERPCWACWHSASHAWLPLIGGHMCPPDCEACVPQAQRGPAWARHGQARQRTAGEFYQKAGRQQMAAGSRRGE